MENNENGLVGRSPHKNELTALQTRRRAENIYKSRVAVIGISKDGSVIVDNLEKLVHHVDGTLDIIEKFGGNIIDTRSAFEAAASGARDGILFIHIEANSIYIYIPKNITEEQCGKLKAFFENEINNNKQLSVSFYYDGNGLIYEDEDYDQPISLDTVVDFITTTGSKKIK